jgi:hypothetical protein
MNHFRTGRRPAIPRHHASAGTRLPPQLSRCGVTAGWTPHELGQKHCLTVVTGRIYLGIYVRREGGNAVAQKVSVTFACDYDSKEIPSGEHLTRAFSLDGREYEIDLCEKHSQKLDEVVSRFADKARRASSRVTRTKRRTTANRQRSADIRSWAKDSGITVSDRGRIPAQIIAKYEASH